MSVAQRLARLQFKRTRKDFYQGLAAAIRDNANLVRQLTKWRNRASRRRQLVASLYSQWLVHMQRGQDLSDAMRGSVPALDTMLLATAENAGDLAGGLEFMARTIEALDRMRKGLVAALAQPVGLSIMFVCMLTGFSAYMIPTLTAVIPPDKWPPVGKALYFVSQGVTNYGPYAGPALLALIAWYIWSLPNWTGRTRMWCDKHLVFYSIYRDYQGAAFIVALAALLQAQIPMAQALKKLNQNASQWMRWNINKMLRRMERARNTEEMAAALNVGIFSTYLSDLIEDYSERSEFDAALKKIGFQAIDKVTDSVVRTAGKLKAAATVVLGATLAFMLLGMLLTAASASSAIKAGPSQSRQL